MADTAPLFPELRHGASLKWYAFRFADGSISENDVRRAVAARRAGEDVHLMPKTLLAAYWMRSVYRSASRT